MRTILALVLREMSTSYGRSPGGYLWAILEPAAGIALLTAIFSAGFRSPALGISFPMFYATGILPFMLFTTISSKLGQAMNYSRQLLAYPRVTFLDAILARFLLNMMTQILVSYLLIGAILLFTETRVVMDGTVIARAYALTGMLALGVGSFNCFMLLRFPLYQQFWSVLTRPLFLISCIFFLYDTIPDPYHDWLWYNPLIHVIGLMRSGVYPNYNAPYVSELYVLGFSLVSLVLGLLFLRRHHKNALER
nr:ABC transporter permease [Mameliella sediminis]